MQKHLCIFALFFIFSNVLNAQKFETKNNEYTYGLMRDACKLPEKTTLFYCGKVIHPLTVKYNAEDEICHLGVALFKDDFIHSFGETTCYFLERLFLTLSLLPGTEIAGYCKEHKLTLSVTELTGNKVLMRKDIEQAIDFITTDDTRYTLVMDSLYCSSTWQNGTQKVELSFPSEYSLVSGMDKKEADDLFEKKLNSLSPVGHIPEALFVDEKDLYDTGRGFFVKPGKSLFIRSMTSDLYVTHRHEEGYSLLYDRKHPAESMSNMAVHPGKNTRKLSIHIKHKAYGGEIKVYRSINLFDFLMFLGPDHNTYIGIEKATDDTLNFTVIFQNRHYNCHHLLYVATCPDTIFNAESHLEGVLYTYIPNHNIKDLYKKYRENGKNNEYE